MEKTIIFGFSLCVTGFFTLVGWCWWLNWQMGKRVTYEWFESHFMKECEKRHITDRASLDLRMVQLTTDVKEIRDAIIGTVDKKGIISKMHEHDDRLRKLEGQ